MPAPLSVVIPTLDAGPALPGTLAALGEGLQSGLIRELVISDGGSQDATRAIADAAGAVLVEGTPGRGGQLRRGAEAARGDWVLLLHGDTRLSDGWAEAVRDHIAHHAAAAGYFHLRFDAPGPMAAFVAGWANLRARAFGLPYGDQGLLLPSALLADKGGVPDMPLMEDVALARAFKGRLQPIGAVAVTSAARYQAEGWLRRGGRNLVILTRYLMGADPVRLAKAYARPTDGSASRN